MSLELFSQRYAARIGCGELFKPDLHLHDFRTVAEEASNLSLDADLVVKRHVDA